MNIKSRIASPLGRRLRFVVVLSVLLASAFAAGATDARASRAPTVAERTGITQEIASFFWRKHQARVVRIKQIRVTTVGRPDAASAFVEAEKRGELQQSVQVFLLRQTSSGPLFGRPPFFWWRLASYGNVGIGCSVPIAALGRDRYFRVIDDLDVGPCP